MNWRWTWVMVPVRDGDAMRCRQSAQLSGMGMGALATRTVLNRLADDAGLEYRLWCVGERSTEALRAPYSDAGAATVMAWSEAMSWLDAPMDARRPEGAVEVRPAAGEAFAIRGEGLEGPVLAAVTAVGLDGETGPEGAEGLVGRCAGAVVRWIRRRGCSTTWRASGGGVRWGRRRGAGARRTTPCRPGWSATSCPC